MGAFYWTKFHHALLDDPLFARLPDRLWRRAGECRLMAGRLARGGLLPELADMAWTLRVDEAQLEAELEELARLTRNRGPDGTEQAGFLEKRDGRWFVVDFATSQGPTPDAERKARQRERDRQARPCVTAGDTDRDSDGHDDDTIRDSASHEAVTNRDTEKSREETDQSREEEKSRTDAPPAARSAAAEPPLVRSFSDWQSAIQVAPGNERPAVLREMFAALFPGHDPPTFARLGKAAIDVGGAGRLAELLWQASTRPPTGDVLSYVTRVAKGRARASPAMDGSEYLRGRYADRVQH